ncbi:S-layer homology domain-containing protein [Paenibacillus filicis]
MEAGIVAGRTDSELAPKGKVTRAEVAVTVQRLLQKSELIHP